MINKKTQRQRRTRATRAKIKELSVHRLCVHRSSNHIYAQIISPCGSKVLAAASTLDKELRVAGQTGNRDAASKVGALIARRAMDVDIKKVAFDRSGFKYHGRVKALADAARESGMLF